MIYIRKLIRNCRGSAMLEFAIGAGMLVSAFTGTFQFGYTFYQYNRLTNAVNGAARYASLRAYDSASNNPSNAFSTAVKNMAVYGNPAGGTTPVVPGLSTSNVYVTVTFVNSVPAFMSVDIRGYSINSVVAVTACNSKPKVTYPYLGLYMPY